MKMSLENEHRWDVSVAEARAIQEHLRNRVMEQDGLGEIRRVAGIDVGIEPDQATARAAVAVLSWPGLALCESATARLPLRFPYVPGYLSFREMPVILAALAKLQTPPDLCLCDGQGRAHPRRFGIACHLGVMTGLPTIGVAKSRLVGVHDRLPERKGAWVPLLDGGEVIGAVVRTRTAVRPVYVSIGHKVGLETAIRMVLQCTTRYRLPETTRWAHRLAGASSDVAPSARSAGFKTEDKAAD